MWTPRRGGKSSSTFIHSKDNVLRSNCKRDTKPVLGAGRAERRQTDGSLKAREETEEESHSGGRLTSVF